MSTGPHTLILDANTAVTFARVNRLDLVTGLPGYRVVIGQIAFGEVKKEPAVSILAKAVRNAALGIEAVSLTDATEAAAWAKFDGMPAFRGRGEAEVLALACTRGYVVASDEVAVCDAAKHELGPEGWLTTTHLLRQAVRDGRLKLTDAVALFQTLDVAAGKMASLRRLGHTIEDLLGS